MEFILHQCQIFIFQVSRIKRDVQVGADQIRAFLEAHILVDIQLMSRCSGESGDDCILLLHELINGMKKGNYTYLPTK